MEIKDFIIVVLVYRNIDDLIDFFSHLSLPKTKVVVVNSFYDKKSELEFQKIAFANGADFLSVPNKGYGYGNNIGVEYALNKYNFKYLIISNADVIVQDLALSQVEHYGDAIIAPDIRNLQGKRQNPSSPFRPSRFIATIRYHLLKGYHYKLIWGIFALSRLNKIIFYCIRWLKKTIFSAHGAFLIISKRALERLSPLYDENMFLFNEEEHLGQLAESRGIKTYYAPNIRILHKEDGSINIASINQLEKTRQSYMVYYDRWIKGRN